MSLTWTALPALSAELPWRQAGLTERQAAAHLLDRLAYGARPGDVDAVVGQGLEVWLEQQLAASAPDPSLERRLAGLDAWSMDASELARTFPSPGMLLRAAMSEDASSAGSMPGSSEGSETDADDPTRRDRGASDRGSQVRMVREYMEANGYRPQRELTAQLMVHKLFQAVQAENQLQEVMTDFWFNHFNVAQQDDQAKGHLLSYERDAIRPHVLGNFRDLLGATARHPAMLLYLDNTASRAAEGRATTLDHRLRRGQLPRGAGRPGGNRPGRNPDRNPNRPTGLNENYARELLELHTVGVDGGYTQTDVIEVARAFTGWVYFPPEDARMGSAGRGRRFPPPAMAERAGFVRDGLFVFHPGFHDAEKKTVLGVVVPPGGGIEDGERVLDLLAAHPSTAHHLATKLAIRFVDDQPSAALIDRLASVFRSTGGETSAVLRALVESPEFWSSRRGKIKTPLELAVSALRAIDAGFTSPPRQVLEALTRMGQPLYSYLAPTGYPDTADFWVNTGALLNRMSFGVSLATGSLGGVGFDLGALNGHREPESQQAALETYSKLLLPERDVAETVRQLEPSLAEEGFLSRLESAAETHGAKSETASAGGDLTRAGGMLEELEDMRFEERDSDRDRDDLAPGNRRGRRGRSAEPAVARDMGPIAQVVALVLGSPEFQRR